MAEAIARCDASDVIEAFSAGLAPLGFVAEMTTQTLIKNGYWVRGLKSKGIRPQVWNQAAIVINMSGWQRELTFSDCSKVEDWEIEDPYGAVPEVYQEVFEKILKRVEELAERCRRKQQAALIADQQEALAAVDLHTRNRSAPGAASPVAVAVAVEKLIQPRNLSPEAQKTFPNAPPNVNTEPTKPQTRVISGDLDREDSPSRILTPRAHLRKRVIPSSYIDLGKSNGGILLNVSEGGFSLAAALPLADTHFSCMRFQLPDCSGWIEARGQIAWRSESRRKAGVRFVELSEEAQQQIKNWISPQVSEAEANPERQASPVLLNQEDASREVDLNPAKSFNLEAARPRATSEQLIQTMNISTEFQTSLDKILDVNTELTMPQRQLISGALEREGGPRPISNRRIHFRKRVDPPSYISLERGNVGIVLNVSEGGLSLAVATALSDAHFLNMRFQIPYCSGWIEAKGQIAWKSESGMEAGVRFVELSEEARGQIRKWIRSKASPSRLQKQLEKIRRAQNLRVARVILGSRGRDEVAQEDWPAEPLLPDPVYSPQEVKAPVTAPRAPKPVGITPAKGVLKARLGARNRRRNIGALGQNWRRIGTVAGLTVLTAFTAGWIARNLNAGKKITLAVARQTRVTTGPSRSETPPLERRIAEAPTHGLEKRDLQPQRGKSLPADKHQNSDTRPRNLPRQVRSGEHSSLPGTVNHPKLPREKAGPVQRTNEPTLAAANVSSPPVQTAAQPQHVESLPAPPPQPEANIASAVSSDPGPSKDAPPLEPKKHESSPSSPKLPERPANLTGLVAIHTDPYPSLRVPMERNSKKSSQGKSLQFGHLVSRVEPAYPEEAKQRGIEGTVKLHAIFGRDGAVESVSSISGPPVLAAAAMNAVRTWHYSQTLLDNKSIEIEEDISVEFRLSNSAAARN
jgi:protein TonB